MALTPERRDYMAAYRSRKDEDDALERRLRVLCRAYEAIRNTPCPERETTRLDLEAALRARGGVFRDGDYLYQWSRTERSLVRMKAVQHPHGTWTHRLG